MTGQTCGLTTCASSCHRPAPLGPGPSCAPRRCYCAAGGCPARQLVDRTRAERVAAGHAAELAWMTQPAMPVDQALELVRAAARAARDEGDLRDALQGEAIASPSGRRLVGFSSAGLVAA